MIDVTFLLIVFFVLVSQIVEIENVEMNLPELVEPATQLPDDEQRLVINVIPGAGSRADGYRLGTAEFAVGPDGLDDLTRALVPALRTNPTLRVNLRADARTHYEWVQPVMKAVSDAAQRTGVEGLVPRVNLVVIPEDAP